MKKILLFGLVFVLLASVVLGNSTLECPTSPITEGYTFSTNMEKAKVKVGYDPDFSKKTFKKFKAEKPIFGKKFEKLVDLAKGGSKGVMYAQAESKKEFSNVCELEIFGLSFLSSEDWLELNPEFEVVLGKRKTGEKLLRIPYEGHGRDDYTFYPFPTAVEYNAGSEISMDIRMPRCRGTGNNKNYFQLHGIGDYQTTLFRGAKWFNMQYDVDVTYPNPRLKVGTFDRNCEGYVYIDNFEVRNGAETFIYNFEE